MKIAIQNRSTQVTNAEARTITMACARQAIKHFAPAWDMKAPTVRYVGSESALKAGEKLLVILDDPDTSGALGYHSETPDGTEYGRVFTKPVLDDGGSVMSGKNSVSSVVSHEVLELLADPWCTVWVDAGRGKQFALEVCDPVQENCYTVMIGGKAVTLSDFVLPEWFDDDENVKQWSWTGAAPGAFKLAPGGYAVVRDSKGEHQIFGRKRPSGWRARKKSHPASRTTRRGA